MFWYENHSVVVCVSMHGTGMLKSMKDMKTEKCVHRGQPGAASQILR